jgi:integrase/recombinase XerD
VRASPVPRGLMTRRPGGTMRSRMAPLVRVPRTLPRVLSPEEADRLVGAATLVRRGTADGTTLRAGPAAR